MMTVNDAEAHASSDTSLNDGDDSPDLKLIPGSVGPRHSDLDSRHAIEVSRSACSGHRRAGGGMKSAGLG